LYSAVKVSMRALSSAIVEGWVGWARSHFFRVCWKRSALPPGGGMSWAGVLLGDVAAGEFGFEGVLASLAAVAGQSDGVDHAVVGECGCGDPVPGKGFAECLDHDWGGDPGVGAHLQGVAGAVVEPADDLDVRAGSAVGMGEPVVGEVGLPGFVGQ